MDTRAALDKVKEVELKSQGVLEKAKLDAQDILKKSQKEKEEILKKIKEKAAADAEKLKIKLHQETLKETSFIANEAENNISALKEKARLNFQKAFDFLKKKIG